MEYKVTEKDGQLQIGEKAMNLLKNYQNLQLQMAKAEMDIDSFKQAMLSAMEKNGIKKFENDYVTLTYIAPTKRKTVDTKKLKDQGLYDMFTKETNVKASVKMAFKDE